MNYLQFDRHQLFNELYQESGIDLLDLTMDAKREVIFYCLDHDIEFHPFENLMCGILDGYLYFDLFSEAQKLGLSNELLMKVYQVYNIIFNQVKLAQALNQN